MNNKVKSVIFCLFAFFLFNLNCYAYDYVIDNYDVVINVGENNKLSIKETIDVNFNTYKHGIIRNIPMYNDVHREDGTSERNRVKISNVSVNDNYIKKTSGNSLNLKIGSANSTLIGPKTYVISYDYFLGNDKNKNFDELYFNIVGTEWDTSIKNVTFKINMPKEFDAGLLGFTHGKYLSSATGGVDYSVQESTIVGSYSNGLLPREGLTVRLQLEEGYFIKDTWKNHIGEFLIYLIPIIFAILSYRIWKKHGKDDEVIETVEFYPPDGLNSLDVAHIYNGRVTSKDVVSLLIYLADKGYLKIENVKKDTLFGKSTDSIIDKLNETEMESTAQSFISNMLYDFSIVKLKDYDGTSKEEEMFLNGLFKKKDVVQKKDLEEKFYSTINSICYTKNSFKNLYKIYDKVASGQRTILLFFMFVVCFLSFVYPVMGYKVSDMVVPTLIVSVVIPLLMSGYALISDNINNVGGIILAMILSLGTFLFAGYMSILFMSLQFILQDVVYLTGIILSFISLLIIYFFYLIMRKRTEYGIQMLGKIKGFRNFLVVAEKEKLEALVNENPNYFYDILPYTYVLGVSDKWIKQFESIAITPPTWYDGLDTFDMITINRNIDRMMHTATRTMTSVPHTTSSSGSSGGSFGGGFSGGGFSGGGSGGGGGSSW